MGLFDPNYTTQTSGTTSQYPDWYSGLQKQISGAATQVASRPYSAYPQERIAGFTPDQQQSFDTTRNAAGAWQPFLDQSQGAIGSALSKSAYGAANPLISQGAGMSAAQSASPLVQQASQTFPGAVDQYMDPYQDQVINRLADLGTRNLFENILPNINDSFIKSGQFGSSRNSDFVNRAIRDTQEGIQGQAAQSLSQGYATAGNLFGQDQSRLAGLAGTVGNLTTADAQRLLQSGQALGQLTAQDAQNALQGARQYADLGTQQQSQALRDAAALSAQGSQQQGQQQKNLDLAQKDFLEQRDWDKNNLDWLAGVASGQRQPTSSTTTTQVPGASTGQQIAGSVLTLAGLPDSFWSSFGLKKGGYVRKMADGGIADVAASAGSGDDWSDRLASLSPEDLRILAMQTTDPEISEAARRMLATKGQDTALSASAGPSAVMGGAGDDDLSEMADNDMDQEEDEGATTQVAQATPLTQVSRPSPMSAQAQGAAMGRDPTNTLPNLTSPAQMAARERLNKLLVPTPRGTFDSPLTQVGLGLLTNRKPGGFLPALGDAVQGMSERERERQDQEKSMQIKAALQELGYADKDALLSVQMQRAMNAGAPKPTAAMKDYETAKAQGYKGSFFDYQKELKAAGSTRIGIDQRQESEEAKQVGKSFGEMYVDTQKAGLGANQANAKLDRLDSLLDQVSTGKLAPASQEFKSTVKGLGFDLESLGIKDDTGPAQAAAALANEMALQLRNPAGGAGMPGAMSENDREFLRSMVPGLSQTPEGRKQMVATMKLLNKRNIEVAQMARDYRKKHGQLNEGFYDELQSFSDSHPLFEGAVTFSDTGSQEWEIVNGKLVKKSKAP